MMNSRRVVGHYDVVLKAQVDNLTGRNEELRRELHELRCEAAKAQDNLNKANCKACLLIACCCFNASSSVISQCRIILLDCNF